ncbi:diguanylate cyclase domain-containing protein [Demequina sp. SO4-18]|uniref:diguanylate cyclase domain-containing protein n=1 Tax=Demequina sp. SO4-18 TaxID=3401026 RepID=UPI003B5A488C
MTEQADATRDGTRPGGGPVANSLTVPDSDARPHLSEDERRRLRECAAEPLHLIDRIQSHAALVCVAPDSDLVNVASDNLAEWLGRSLSEVHPELARAVADAHHGSTAVTVPLLRRRYHATIHREAARSLIEFEPVMDGEGLSGSVAEVVETIHRLSDIGDPDQMLATALAEIKAITGFERVACLQFLDNGRGKVVAEVREPDMESQEGLYFPASDIPAQARALYARKLSRSVVDSHDGGQGLLTLDSGAASRDLTGTHVRMIGGHHLEFMRRMGQVATLSLSLVADGELMGIIIGSHRSRHQVPPPVRRVLELLARTLASRLGTTTSILRLQRQLDLRRRRTEFLAPFYGTTSLSRVVDDASTYIREVVECDGAYLRLRGKVRTNGAVPQPEHMDRALSLLGGEQLITDALSRDRPDLAEHLGTVAGMIAIPVSGEADYLVFLRMCTEQDVQWLGDQTPANRDSPVSPRCTFTRWHETVTSEALPWGPAVEDAFDLAHDIQTALDAREHARLARHDPLTGLPNRRYLDEVAEPLVGGYRERLAAIFLDLDDFKDVNDTHGHGVGDAVLKEMGARLARATRDRDFAVRLSGDEFVMLCLDVDEEEATIIADRLVGSLAEPVIVGEASFTVRVSAGVAMGGHGLGFDDLLQRADQAMYRDKRDG